MGDVLLTSTVSRSKRREGELVVTIVVIIIIMNIISIVISVVVQFVVPLCVFRTRGGLGLWCGWPICKTIGYVCFFR